VRLNLWRSKSFVEHRDLIDKSLVPVAAAHINVPDVHRYALAKPGRVVMRCGVYYCTVHIDSVHACIVVTHCSDKMPYAVVQRGTLVPDVLADAVCILKLEPNCAVVVTSDPPVQSCRPAVTTNDNAIAGCAPISVHPVLNGEAVVLAPVEGSVVRDVDFIIVTVEPLCSADAACVRRRTICAGSIRSADMICIGRAGIIQLPVVCHLGWTIRRLENLDAEVLCVCSSKVCCYDRNRMYSLLPGGRCPLNHT